MNFLAWCSVTQKLKQRAVLIFLESTSFPAFAFLVSDLDISSSLLPLDLLLLDFLRFLAFCYQAFLSASHLSWAWENDNCMPFTFPSLDVSMLAAPFHLDTANKMVNELVGPLDLPGRGLPFFGLGPSFGVLMLSPPPPSFELGPFFLDFSSCWTREVRTITC